MDDFVFRIVFKVGIIMVIAVISAGIRWLRSAA